MKRLKWIIKGIFWRRIKIKYKYVSDYPEYKDLRNQFLFFMELHQITSHHTNSHQLVTSIVQELIGKLRGFEEGHEHYTRWIKEHNSHSFWERIKNK